MKFLKIIVLMLLVFNYSYSASKIMPENDWSEKELKGKVKKMTTTEYKYSGNKETIKKIEINFNEQGYITEEIHYSKDRTPFIYKYEYNKDGLLAKKNDYTNRKWYYTYKYDENGNLVQIGKPEIRNNSDKKTKKYDQISYDKTGKKLKVNFIYGK